MGFTDPNSAQNPTTGVAIATAWGDQVNTDLLALYGPPRVRVHKSGTGSVTTATLTVVTFDTEDIDTHVMHDNVTNAGRLTVPTGWGGDWLLCGTVQWAVNTGGTRRHAEIKDNNGNKMVDDDVPATASGYATQNLACLVTAVAGAWWELSVYQDSGGALNVQNDGLAGTIFAAFFLGSGAG